MFNIQRKKYEKKIKLNKKKYRIVLNVKKVFKKYKNKKKVMKLIINRKLLNNNNLMKLYFFKIDENCIRQKCTCSFERAMATCLFL